MGLIYNFDDYRAQNPLETSLQQVGEELHQIHEADSNIKSTNGRCARLLMDLQEVSLILEASQTLISRTLELIREFSAACEMNSVEEMITARDRIILNRYRAKSELAVI